MSDVELKSISTTAHKYLLSLLEVEKRDCLEPYVSAGNIGEKMREYFMDLGQLDTLPPIPKLDKNK